MLCMLKTKNGMLLQPQLFSRHFDEMYPIVKQGDEDYSACDGIPRQTIILESLIKK